MPPADPAPEKKRGVSRQYSLYAVLGTIIESGPVSRASIAQQTSLSKQTVSEIVRLLESDGWIRETGRTSGHIGRSAVTFEIDPEAACILAVDLGGTKVRAALADLSCRVRAEISEPTDERGGRAVVAQIARLAASLKESHPALGAGLRLAVIGIPGVPDAEGRAGLCPNIPGLEEFSVAEALEEALGVPVLLENDVNLAAYGEYWAAKHGEEDGADGADDSPRALSEDALVFVALGTGIGAGVVLDGVLLRGAKGIAGEIGYLPSFAGDAGGAGSNSGSNEYNGIGSGPLERYVAKHGIMSRYEAQSGSRLEVHEIFAAADDGDARASEVLDDTAREIGRVAAILALAINPAQILFGGSIGERPELLARVQRRLPRLPGEAAPRIRPARLGPHANLVGAGSDRTLAPPRDPLPAPRPGGHPHPPLRRGGDSGQLHRRCARKCRRFRQSKRGRLVSASSSNIGRQVAERLQEEPEREAALGFLQRAIGAESVTGNEANFVKMLQGELAPRGFDSLQTGDFLPGRPNLWCERKGTGDGPRLLFIGHSDTVHVRGWSERWAGTERESPFSGAIVDGEIWGRGSGDLKAGICASLEALRLLESLGLRPAGDVAYAFVGDEESGEPGSGISAGVKDYVRRLREGEAAKPDFAVYVEPTQLAVYPAQMGFFIAEAEFIGKSAYFGVPELGRDALKAAHSALAALWRHSDDIAARGEHDLVGRAFLLVTEIQGGGYIAVPERCSFSLIRKLLPDEDLSKAAAELEEVIRGAVADKEIKIELRYPAGRDHELGGTPCEIPRDLAPVQQLSRALAEALPGRGGHEGAPYWSEAPFFVRELGCPAVYCAPGDIRNCHTLEERVAVDEYLAGIAAFASFIAEYCGLAAGSSNPASG